MVCILWTLSAVISLSVIVSAAIYGISSAAICPAAGLIFLYDVAAPNSSNQWSNSCYLLISPYAINIAICKEYHLLVVVAANRYS